MSAMHAGSADAASGGDLLPGELVPSQEEIEQQLELAGEEELRRYRKPGAFWTGMFYGATVLSVLLAINQLFNLRFGGIFVLIDNRYLYLLSAILLPLVFVMIPFDERKPGKRVPWYDNALAALTFVTLCYFVWEADHILEEGWEYSAPWHAILASCILWLLFLEIGRRTGGWVIFWITVVWSLFPVYVGLMPEVLSGVPQDILTTAGFHMMSAESFLGAPMQAFGGLIFGFLVFGVAMQYTGAGTFFINIAFALLGTVRGGPAKVAIFASSLFGSMSGSAVSNVLTVGCMTIPAMVRVGFPSKYAAAVEANASTGGTLMPPVMGATAFVMASYLGVPYAEVALAAFLPSVLYYFGLFVQIDSFAAKHGIVGIPKVEVPSLWQTIKDGWYYCAAFACLMWMLLWLQREATAPFYATALLLAVNQLSPRHRMNLARLKQFIQGSGLIFVELAGVLAPIGLLIGALTVTGMLGTLTNDLVFLAGNNTLVLLVMGAVTSFILGLGLTTTACYIFLAVILAPALETQGLDRMAVHMFLLYWGMVSLITPPVALAAFAAASIAKANAWDTGIEACKIGLIIYFVPFFFAYNPALMMRGGTAEILLVITLALVGVTLTASALQDYLVGFGTMGTTPFAYAGRIAVFAGGLLLAAPARTAGLDVGELLLLAVREVAVAGVVVVAGLALCRLARARAAPV